MDTYDKDLKNKDIDEKEKALIVEHRDIKKQRFATTLTVAKEGLEKINAGVAQLEGKPTAENLEVMRKSLLQFCATAHAQIKAAKGPDCACINKTEGPDCACINKTEKGPDCACINSKPIAFLQLKAAPAPEDQLAKEMTHDLEMNFNKIAPFGKEDTAKLQDHAAKTQ